MRLKTEDQKYSEADEKSYAELVDRYIVASRNSCIPAKERHRCSNSQFRSKAIRFYEFTVEQEQHISEKP